MIHLARIRAEKARKKKKETMKLITTLFLATLLAACSSVDRAGPAATGGPSKGTTLVGHEDRETPYTWQSFIPMAVDGRAVKHSFFSNQVNTVVNVEPGVRRIVVRAAFNAGMGSGGIREATVLLVSPVEAGKAYRLNGKVLDKQMVVWLEDVGTGQRLAEEGAGNWAFALQESGVVLIPKKK